MPVSGQYAVQSGGGGGWGLPGAILHGFTKYGGRTIHDFESAAINSIPGFYHLAGGLIHDPISTIEGVGSQVLSDFRHPLRHPGFTILDLLALEGGAGAFAGRLGEAAAISSRAGALPAEIATRELAQAAGRSAEFNIKTDRVVNPHTGEATYNVKPAGAQIKHALIHGLPKEVRVLRMPVPKIEGENALLTTDGLTDTATHGWVYSKDPLIRKAQKLVDKAYEQKFSEGVPPPIWRVLGGPAFWRTQSSRINSSRKAENVINRMTSRAKGAQFLAKYGTKSDAEHMAVRMVADLTMPEARLNFHQGILDSGALTNPKFVAETNKTMETIRDASKFVEPKEVMLNDGTKHVVPVIKAEYPELQQYVEDARSLSNDRSTASRLAGVLSEESHYRRLLGPLNLILHGKIPDNITTLLNDRKRYVNLRQTKEVEKIDRRLSEAMGQMSLEGLSPSEELIAFEQAKELANETGAFRVPYNVEKPPVLGFGQSSFRRAYTGKKPKTPGTYTHPFTGAILKYGGGDANVARLLAESYTEAHRFIALLHARDFILKNSRATPDGIPEEYRQLIRDDQYLRGGAMNYDQAGRYAQTPELKLLEKDGFSPQDSVAGGYLYEGIRNHIFPDMKKIPQALWDVLRGGEKQTFQPVPGYRWIDKRLLGGLDKKNPIYGAFENGVFRRAVHATDMVNNIQKSMILYLKPAYALPNLLGNVGLSLVQQGFLAPFNLAKTFRMRRTLDEPTLAQIRGAVGQGVAESTLQLQGGIHNSAYGLTNKFADLYGKVIDDPFREASFLHEAQLAGFKTKAELRDLVNNPDYIEEFRDVANRANEALINYERLGPGEQAIMRRLVFFYPWVKGSSRYAAQFPKEHPLAAGLHGIAGQQGEERIARYLGEVPSFAEGLIPYDVSNSKYPVVGKTSSVSILGEPAELAKIVGNIVSTNPNADLPASMNLSPSDAFLLALITAGQQTTLGHPGSERPISSAIHEAVGGNPIWTLQRQLRGKSASGGPLDMSLYPDPSKLHALMRFFVTGGLTPTPYSRLEGELKAYKQQHPGYVG